MNNIEITKLKPFPIIKKEDVEEHPISPMSNDYIYPFVQAIWIDFKPDYSKCIDDRKELHHNLCKNLKKNDEMYCTLNNRSCVAWEGYKHE
jgi:hypothetical protein